MASDLERPLAGIRVIDQADGNGEMCGRLLADLGAEVIRIEPPGGAASRRMPPFHGDTSLYFTVRNLGKKSVTLDMEAGDGRVGDSTICWTRPTFGSSRIVQTISIVAKYSSVMRGSSLRLSAHLD